jgi:hypothetical protein
LNKSRNRFLVLLLAACQSTTAADWLFRPEVIKEPVTDRFSVCFDHSSRTIVTRSFTSQEWQTVTRPIQPPSPDADADLKLLQQEGLLKHHAVQDQATRFGLLAGMPHTTAVILDVEARQRYAVDSWFFDNGKAPVIIPLAEWKSGWRPGGEQHE